MAAVRVTATLPLLPAPAMGAGVAAQDPFATPFVSAGPALAPAMALLCAEVVRRGGRPPTPTSDIHAVAWTSLFLRRDLDCVAAVWAVWEVGRGGAGQGAGRRAGAD
jgi:hypothetical protein